MLAYTEFPTYVLCYRHLWDTYRLKSSDYIQLVGKTSFIKRFVHQFFSQNYRATIGVDFALKVLHWDNNTIVRLQLWDIAGQERFGNMTRVYYKEAVGAFIVFDVTRSGTFDCVSKWKEDLDSKVQLPDGSPIPCILLANKVGVMNIKMFLFFIYLVILQCDKEKQGIVVSPEKMDEYVRQNGFAGWYETSTKENINIDEAARALVNKILLNDKLISAADLADCEKFNLNNSADQTATEPKSKCSCWIHMLIDDISAKVTYLLIWPLQPVTGLGLS